MKLPHNYKIYIFVFLVATGLTLLILSFCHISIIGILWILYLSALFAVLIYFRDKRNKAILLSKKKAKIARQQEINRKLNEKISSYKNSKQKFIEKIGLPDKTIIIHEYDLAGEILVYEETKKIFILGNEYNFCDIISCKVTDNPIVVKGDMQAVTQTNNSNAFGRAVVGGLLAGSAGAIIGGSTAKKSTQFSMGNDVTYHDYTISINVDSISNPVINIHTKQDMKLTNEIAGLMNVIISRNKK